MHIRCTTVDAVLGVGVALVDCGLYVWRQHYQVVPPDQADSAWRIVLAAVPDATQRAAISAAIATCSHAELVPLAM